MKESIGSKFPLYCLGFGYDVNFDFLTKMSLENNGVARRIYEDSDADLQLQVQYREWALNSCYVSAFNSLCVCCVGLLWWSCRPAPHRYSTKLHRSVKSHPDQFQLVLQRLWNCGVGSNHRQQCGERHHWDHRYICTIYQSFLEETKKCSKENDWYSFIVMQKGSKVTYRDTVTAKDVSDVQPEHENFLERLWAYLTVKQLLDRQ